MRIQSLSTCISFICSGTSPVFSNRRVLSRLTLMQLILFIFSTSIGYNFIVYDVKLGELRMGPSFTRVCLFCQTFFTWFVYKHTRYESDSFLFCGFDHHCNVLFTFRAWSLLPILREEKITK